MPIGKLEPFSLSSKQWPAYIRRVNQYILLNDVKDNLKVPMLITVVGESTYALMCDLCSPDFPENKTYEELVKLVADHLEPQRSEIAERHVFRLRRQREGEPLAERGRTRGARNTASAAGAPGAASTGRAASTDCAARPSNGGSAARAG
ncbi:hypothetical protein HW555_011804 [Spodoptera exigua]|uniref:Uncharacterized protein n=1 Tax=Spodoptera exigua TaxID=7107 RepID=A0A835G6D8_SPOEX|nr:hypothetical protein HW555_011804 [Spodoptera exigua]